MRLKIALACLCMLTQIGLLSANDNVKLQNHCASDNDHCESRYEQHLKQKMLNRGFFRSEIAKRRSYPYIDKAFRLYGAGKVQQAITELDKYLSVDPEHDLVRWYQLVMASTQSDAGKTIQLATRFIERNSDSGPAFLIRGNAYWKAGNYGSAEQDFQAARTKKLYGYAQPKDLLVSLYLLAYGQGDYEKAIHWVNELLSVEKGSVGVKVTRANLYEKMHRDDDAITAWNEVLALTGEKSIRHRALLSLGNLYARRADYSHAFEMFGQALKLEDNPQTRINAAESAWNLRDYQSVQLLLEPLVRMDKLNGDREFDLRLRYCETLDKLGKASEALSCIKVLAENYPDRTPLVAYGTDLAYRSGNRTEYIAGLIKLYKEKPTAKTASMIAHAMEKDGRKKEAEKWHAKAFSASNNPRYALAYADSLSGNNRSFRAIDIYKEVVTNWRSTERQREYAFTSMANIYLQKGKYSEADKLWEQAYTETGNPVYIMRRVIVNNLAGKSDLSWQIVSPYEANPPAGLPGRFHEDWYAAAGEAYLKHGKYRESIAVLEKLVERAPTADHFLLLAEAYRADDNLQKADELLLKASYLSNRVDDMLLERAYMFKQAGDIERAEQLLLQAQKMKPHDARIREELGYVALLQGRNEQAVTYFKAAIDGYAQRDSSGGEQKETASRLENLRQTVAGLEDHWTFSFYDGVCLGSDGCEAAREGLISPFGQGFGQVEIAYRPELRGLKDGKQLQIYSRLLWRNEKESLRFESGSLRPIIGVRFKPFAEQNFWASLAYLMEGGVNTEEHLLLHAAWSKTRGNDWTLADARDFKGYPLKNYFNLYADAGKLFKNSDSFLAYAEGRKGKTVVFNRHALLSGFGYLRGSYESGDNDLRAVDAGIGLEGRYRDNFDHYRGYQREWGLVFRVGKELENSRGDEGARANVGISVRF